MKTLDRKFSFTVASLSVLVACSLFTPSVSETLTPFSDTATIPESRATSLDTTPESQTTSTEDTFQMPGGRLLISTREGDPNLTSDFSYEYFMLSLPDKVVEPFPLLVDVDPITGHPVYSPDYSHLGFQRYDRDSQVFSIYLFGPENDEAQMISQRTDNKLFEELTWSFNGRFFTFESGYIYTDDGTDIIFYIYDIESGSLDEIRFQTQLPQFPDLSPNGDQIAFSSQAVELNEFGEAVPGGKDLSGLYLMNSDGSDEHQLVAGQVWNLKWHPDGTRIFYEREVTNFDTSTNTSTIISPGQIYSYDLASGVETLMTPSDKPVLLHDFSPDGKFMIYTSESGIYLISTDGGTPIDLAHLISDGWTWSPDGQYFATPIWNAATETSNIYIIDSQGSGRLVKVYSDINTVIAWLP